MKEREDLREEKTGQEDEEIPPTYDTATSPTTGGTMMRGSPSIGQLSSERDMKR